MYIMYMHALVMEIERDIIQGFLRPNYIIYRLKRSLILVNILGQLVVHLVTFEYGNICIHKISLQEVKFLFQNIPGIHKHNKSWSKFFVCELLLKFPDVISVWPIYLESYLLCYIFRQINRLEVL